MPIWNTLDVPLETGWQCTLIPAPRYTALMRRGRDRMEARSLYPHAGRDRWPPPWNAPELDEQEKRRKWEKDVKQQLADDRRAFARYFRPNWDLRTITGGNALREIQNFVRDALRAVHWNLPNDNEGVRRMLCEAVVNKRLIPVVNREYRGRPRVAQPDPAPLRWPRMSGGVAAGPEIISYIDFVALQRANGELGCRASSTAAVGRTVGLDSRPELRAAANGGPTPIEDCFGDSQLSDSTPLGSAQPFEVIRRDVR